MVFPSLKLSRAVFCSLFAHFNVFADPTVFSLWHAPSLTQSPEASSTAAEAKRRAACDAVISDVSKLPLVLERWGVSLPGAPASGLSKEIEMPGLELDSKKARKKHALSRHGTRADLTACCSVAPQKDNRKSDHPFTTKDQQLCEPSGVQCTSNRIKAKL
jgi:hypothetical protein